MPTKKPAPAQSNEAVPKRRSRRLSAEDAELLKTPGGRIQILRKKLDWSQQEVVDRAAKAGFRFMRPQLSLIETNKNKGTKTHWRKGLAAAFGLADWEWEDYLEKRIDLDEVTAIIMSHDKLPAGDERLDRRAWALGNIQLALRGARRDKWPEEFLEAWARRYVPSSINTFAETWDALRNAYLRRLGDVTQSVDARIVTEPYDDTEAEIKAIEAETRKKSAPGKPKKLKKR